MRPWAYVNRGRGVLESFHQLRSSSGDSFSECLNHVINKQAVVRGTTNTAPTRNVIRSSHGHSTPSLKISCRSVQPFSHNLADKETKKQTKKLLDYNTPSPVVPGGGVITNNFLSASHIWCLWQCQQSVLISLFLCSDRQYVLSVR